MYGRKYWKKSEGRRAVPRSSARSRQTREAFFASYLRKNRSALAGQAPPRPANWFYFRRTFKRCFSRAQLFAAIRASAATVICFFAGTNAACSEKTKDSKSSDWILQHLPARYPARKTLVPCTSIPFLIQHKTVLVWTLWLAATCELVSSIVHLSAHWSFRIRVVRSLSDMHRFARKTFPVNQFLHGIPHTQRSQIPYCSIRAIRLECLKSQCFLHKY